MSQPTPTSTHHRRLIPSPIFRPIFETEVPTTRTEPTTGTGSLIRSLPAGTMEGPYSARFPSSPIGETSRRAPAGREAADERSSCTRPHRPPHRSGPGSFVLGFRANRRPDCRVTRARRQPSATSRSWSSEWSPCWRDVPAGLLVDATLGGGGHARALLQAHAGLHLIGVDQDDDALGRLGRAGRRTSPGRVAARPVPLRPPDRGGDGQRRRPTGGGGALRPRGQLAPARPGATVGSATGRTPRSTCAWTAGPTPRAADRRQRLPRGRAGLGAAPVRRRALRRPHRPGHRRRPPGARRRPSWPTSSGKPSRRRPGAAVATRPSGPSRPSASR